MRLRRSERHETSIGLPAVLSLLGLIGVGSLALAPIGSLAPEGIDPDTFRWLALIQPAILTIGAALLGHAFARRVGLDAPLLRAIMTGGPAGRVLLNQAGPALIGGIMSGAVLLLYAATARGALPPSFEVPAATRLLYGGVTEEIIARWGVMSFAAWLGWRLFGNRSAPTTAHLWFGNATAALLFSLGHLPLLFALNGPATPGWLIAAVVGGNMVPALIFGWLYARRGLEAAMIAHASAHVMALLFAA